MMLSAAALIGLPAFNFDDALSGLADLATFPFSYFIDNRVQAASEELNRSAETLVAPIHRLADLGPGFLEESGDWREESGDWREEVGRVREEIRRTSMAIGYDLPLNLGTQLRNTLDHAAGVLVGLGDHGTEQVRLLLVRVRLALLEARLKLLLDDSKDGGAAMDCLLDVLTNLKLTKPIIVIGRPQSPRLRPKADNAAKWVVDPGTELVVVTGSGFDAYLDGDDVLFVQIEGTGSPPTRRFVPQGAISLNSAQSVSVNVAAEGVDLTPADTKLVFIIGGRRYEVAIIADNRPTP